MNLIQQLAGKEDVFFLRVFVHPPRLIELSTHSRYVLGIEDVT